MLDYLIDEIDLVLIMSVNPGFGGQSFISSQLRKIEAVRKMIDKTGRPIHLEVDGGVDATTAPLCVAAGADALVAGTATFKGGPDRYAANIAALKGSADPVDEPGFSIARGQPAKGKARAVDEASPALPLGLDRDPLRQDARGWRDARDPSSPP
jgi:hypothetical protein